MLNAGFCLLEAFLESEISAALFRRRCSSGLKPAIKFRLHSRQTLQWQRRTRYSLSLANVSVKSEIQGGISQPETADKLW